MPDQDETTSSRYSRQERFAPLGVEGQRKLRQGSVLIVGCGALGSVSANTLVRAGVGLVRIVDRDFLELSNLQRQVLFDEQDVARGLPKAIVAADKLTAINSDVTVEPVVADLTHANISELANGVEVIVDGTDNFETRLLLNDYAVSTGRPWIYGGCLGAEGQVMPILPGETACLTCLMPQPPSPGSTPTCDSAGILGPAVNLVASMQATEAIKLLSGKKEAVSRHLIVIDLWQNRIRQLDLSSLHAPGSCRTCHQRHFPWLEGRLGSEASVLCGRNSVQIRPAEASKIVLEDLAARVAQLGEVTSNPFLVRLSVDDFQITVFADGRAIVGGTEDAAIARSLLAKYIGN
ncbi:MAG: ThiF family adenylyltransferase [Planctomycetota bacterium]